MKNYELIKKFIQDSGVDKYLSLRNQINEILCWFDFEKQRKIMKFMNWKVWEDNDFEIPDISKLRDDALDVLEKTAFDPNVKTSYSNYCYRSIKYVCEDDIYVSLIFSPVSWDPCE